jgi:hypothetical protein
MKHGFCLNNESVILEEFSPTLGGNYPTLGNLFPALESYHPAPAGGRRLGSHRGIIVGVTSGETGSTFSGLKASSEK